MQTDEIRVSEWLSEFLRELEQCQKDYEWAVEEETRQERLTQDYLHMLELSALSYHQQAKIAAELKRCRMERRNAKDMIATLEPIAEFLSTERGKLLTGQLQQVLGKVRKAEKHIDQRSYTPKVLSKEDFPYLNAR